MSDAAFKPAPFPAYTTAQLKAALENEKTMPADIAARMSLEIERREKVAAGDVSVMTPAERLRHFRKA